MSQVRLSADIAPPERAVEEEGIGYGSAFGLGCLIMFAVYGFVKFAAGAWSRFKRENLP